MVEISDTKLEELLKQHLVNDNTRLDRIESKIDQLAETVVALARAEEKLVSLERSRQEISDVLDNHSERIDKVEDVSASNSLTLSVVTKLGWLMVGTCITFFISQYVVAP